MIVVAADQPDDPNQIHREFLDPSWATIEAEIRDLRARLQAVGPVDLEALAELESLEARYGGLAAQYKDLGDITTLADPGGSWWL